MVYTEGHAPVQYTILIIRAVPLDDKLVLHVGSLSIALLQLVFVHDFYTRDFWHTMQWQMAKCAFVEMFLCDSDIGHAALKSTAWQ